MYLYFHNILFLVVVVINTLANVDDEFYNSAPCSDAVFHHNWYTYLIKMKLVLFQVPRISVFFFIIYNKFNRVNHFHFHG